MRRRIRIILLSAGAALGYGFAFHAMHHHHDRRGAFERHIADVCIDAYRRQSGGPTPASHAPVDARER